MKVNQLLSATSFQAFTTAQIFLVMHLITGINSSEARAQTVTEVNFTTTCTGITGDKRSHCLARERSLQPPDVLGTTHTMISGIDPMDGSRHIGPGYVGLGTDMVLSEEGQVFSLPISYLLNLGKAEAPIWTSFGLILPLERWPMNPLTGADESAYGLGNIALSAGATLGKPESFRHEGELLLTIPTETLSNGQTELFLGYTGRRMWQIPRLEVPVRLSAHLDYRVQSWNADEFSLWNDNTIQFWGEVLATTFQSLQLRGNLGITMQPVDAATDIRFYDFHLAAMYRIPVAFPLYVHVDTLLPLMSSVPEVDRSVTLTAGVRTSL